MRPHPSASSVSASPTYSISSNSHTATPILDPSLPSPVLQPRCETLTQGVMIAVTQQPPPTSSSSLSAPPVIATTSKRATRNVTFADSKNQPLTKITNFFKRPCEQNPIVFHKLLPKDIHVQPLDDLKLLIGVPNDAVSASRKNVMACIKHHKGTLMSCSGVTLKEEDILSMISGEQLCDSVSLTVCN
jgi:hypothetical protein